LAAVAVAATVRLAPLQLLLLLLLWEVLLLLLLLAALV